MTGGKIIKMLSASTRRPIFAPAVLFAVSLAAYLSKLPRTVSFEDSAEFVTVAASLGLPHPSGYPLYVLLAHPFSYLPFGTMPWRIALFSALCSSAAVALVYVLARRLAGTLRLAGGPAAAAAIGAAALQLAFSEVWWSQAVYAKVYGLHSLLLLAAVWLLVRYAEKPSSGRLFSAFLVLGLAASNHLFLTAPVAPFFLAGAVLAAPPAWRRPAAWGAAAAGIAVGLLPYLYLPLRFASGAPFYLEPVGTWHQFVDFVLRRRYQDLGLASFNKFGLLGACLWHLVAYIGPLFVILAAAGTVLIFRKHAGRIARSAGVVLAGGVLAAPLAQLLRSSDLNTVSEYLARAYSTSGYAFLSVLAALGAAALIGAVSSAGWKRAAVAAALLVIPLAALSGNWTRVDAYRSDFAENYGRRLIETLPPGAVLIVKDDVFTHDTEVFVLAYLQIVEGLRPDVSIVEDSGINRFVLTRLPPAYRDFRLSWQRRMLVDSVLRDARFAGRPIFMTFAAEPLKPGWRSRADGLHYEFLRDPSAARGEPGPGFDPPPLPPERMLAEQPALGQIAAHALYLRASREIETSGDSKKALDELVEAIRYDLTPNSMDYAGFVSHRFALINERGERSEPAP